MSLTQKQIDSLKSSSKAKTLAQSLALDFYFHFDTKEKEYSDADILKTQQVFDFVTNRLFGDLFNVADHCVEAFGVDMEVDSEYENELAKNIGYKVRELFEKNMLVAQEALAEEAV